MGTQLLKQSVDGFWGGDFSLALDLKQPSAHLSPRLQKSRVNEHNSGVWIVSGDDRQLDVQQQLCFFVVLFC